MKELTREQVLAYRWSPEKDLLTETELIGETNYPKWVVERARLLVNLPLEDAIRLTLIFIEGEKNATFADPETWVDSFLASRSMIVR